LSDNESSIAQILESFPSLLESAFPKLLERLKEAPVLREAPR
jgi:hypothetical protein